MEAFAAAPIRWNSLVELAEYHGVLPLLAQVLMDVGDWIPAGERETLRQRYQANLHKALFLSRELIRILDCLSAQRIEVMPYKGLALAETIYGDIALRQCGDIDLLIHRKDLKQIRSALTALGFVPHCIVSESEEEAYLSSGYEYSFDAPAGKNLLEVQWAIQPRFYAVDLSVEDLFEHAITIRVAGMNVPSPSSEDMFIVLALHAAKHVWGRLIWTCDLAKMSHLSTLDWDQIAVKARKLGIARILRITLLLSQRLLDSSIPHGAEKSLPKDSIASQLSEEISRGLGRGETMDVESAPYFRLMLRLRERQLDRIRFVSRLLLTPGPGEWRTVRLPKPLSPLYRVLRLTRLGTRLIGGFR